MKRCIVFVPDFLGLAASQAQPILGGDRNHALHLHEGDKVVGTATEVVELTLQRAGLKDYSVHLYPWARAWR